MKICTKCQETKPLSDFAKDKSKKDGLGSNCKACKRRYREANKADRKIKDAAYYQANKARITKVKQAYRSKNRDKILAYAKKYYQENKEHILATKKKYKRAMVRDLTDEYIKSKIVESRSWLFGRAEITPELIELKRYEIIIQRILKAKKNEI